MSHPYPLPKGMKTKHVRILMALAAAVAGCALGHTAMAQGAGKITLKPGQSPSKKVYLHPAFQQSKVLFTNGGTNTSLLNYNLLTGEIEFINKAGDTLALSNMASIQTISLGEDVFVHDPVTQHVLAKVEEFENLSVFVKKKYELKDRKQIGAYGMPTTSTSPTNVREYMADNTMYRFSGNEEVIYAVEPTYYLQDQNKLFHVATRANLLRLTANHKNEVEKFLKNNRINFKSGQDLKKVLEFYSGL